MRTTSNKERVKQAKLERLACHVNERFNLNGSAEDVVRLPGEALVGEGGRGLELRGEKGNRGLVADTTFVGKCHSNTHTPDWCHDSRVGNYFKCVTAQNVKHVEWNVKNVEWNLRI